VLTCETQTSAPSSDALENKELALVRVVNAIPGEPALVIFAGDSSAFSGVGYNSGQGGYHQDRG